MLRHFVIIRGAPGAGKSRTARELVSQIRGGVIIEVDKVRAMINGVIWDNHQQHFDAIAAATAAAKAYRLKGYDPVVLVDTLGFGSLQMALDGLGRENVSVYSLVCQPQVLKWRVRRRLCGFRDAVKAVRFNDHILADEAYLAGLVDTTRLRPSEVVARIIELGALKS